MYIPNVWKKAANHFIAAIASLKDPLKPVLFSVPVELKWHPHELVELCAALSSEKNIERNDRLSVAYFIHWLKNNIQLRARMHLTDIGVEEANLKDDQINKLLHEILEEK